MISAYRDKVYSFPPCWELVTDVYINELKYKTKSYLPDSDNLRDSAAALRLALHNNEHGLEKIDSPKDYCVVLMGRTIKLGLHHCGIYYKGKVLHALPSGNVYQDISSLQDTYKLMEFWSIKEKDYYEN